MLASLTFIPDQRHGDAARFDFLAAQFPDTGMPVDIAVDLEEELTSAGVNFMRWRTLRADYPAFRMITWAQAADIEAARILARRHWRGSGRLAHLSLTWGTRRILYRRVHVGMGVLAQPRPGAPAGLGVAAGSTATVLTDWMLRCTEEGA